VFDSERRELTRSGESVRLTPKAFDLLAALIAERPRAVRKQALYEMLWPETFVEYANLNNLVAEIRAAIGDRDRTIVQTRPRYGFVFAAETSNEPEEQPRTGRRRLYVMQGEKICELEQGRNLIGRDPECAVIIDSPAVSRFHAAIDVSDETAILEDLASKNGTFLGDRRIEGPTPLRDRDEIEIGRTLLRFHVLDRKASTVSGPRTR